MTFRGKLKPIIRADILADLYKINYKSKRAEAAFSNLTKFCQTRSPDQIFRRKIVNPMPVPMILIGTICLKVVRETF